MINVTADKYLFQLEEMMPDGINLRLYDPEDGFPENIAGIHALLIRTVTPINFETIHKLPESLSFIGTGSAGTDHIDQELLKDRNITFANAAGCNARSVAEYVCTALLIWADQKQVDLIKKTVGIVGVGHVGSQLNSMLGKLGVSTICYDPPREQRDSKFSSASLAEVLSADILTFHIPLTLQGRYASHHWLDEEKLNNHHFDLVINTARGGVVDEEALLKAKYSGAVMNYIIDVWENEPVFNNEVANNAFIYTPHIAGYSIQAKQRASSIIVEAMCQHFGISFKTPHLAQNSSIIPSSNPDLEDSTLTKTLEKIHPIFDYQKELSLAIGLSPSFKKTAFNRIRSLFPLRNEYIATTIPSHLIRFKPIQKLFN